MQERDRLYALRNLTPIEWIFFNLNWNAPSCIKMYCYTYFFLLQFSHASAQKYLGLGYGIWTEQATCLKVP